MRVRLFATLRSLVGDRQVELEVRSGETVRTILERLADAYPRLEGELLTPDRRELLPHVQVFIGGHSIRHMQGLETVLESPVDMAVFPPVAGG